MRRRENEKRRRSKNEKREMAVEEKTFVVIDGHRLLHFRTQGVSITNN